MKVLTAIMLAVFSLFSPNNNPDAQERSKHEWKYLGLSYGFHDEVDEMYYDAQNIEQTHDGFTRVLLKHIGVYKTEKEKLKRLEEFRQNRKLNKFSLEGYDKFSYSVLTIEFDCKKKLRRYPCVADYDEAEKKIGSQCLEGLNWEMVPEESLAKKVFDVVCTK